MHYKEDDEISISTSSESTTNSANGDPKIVDADVIFVENEVQEIKEVEVIDDDSREHTTLLSLLDELDKQKPHRIPLSKEMEAATHLLTLLHSSNASLQLYSKILKWAEDFIPGAKNQ